MKKKVFSLILAIFMIASTTLSGVYASSNNIEIVFTDVTQDDQSTLSGEAKIKVGIKGATGKITAVQTALKFEGALKYKSIEFLQGTNNPPECFFIPPNAALANSSGKILPSIATNSTGALTFTDETTDLFIITFAGDPGNSVKLSLNNESSAGTYCAVNNNFVTTSPDSTAIIEAQASAVTNEGVNAIVKLVMDKIDDFTVSTGSGYADSKITLTITNETTGTTISTVLNTVSNTKGGHYDSSSSIPTFIVENKVVSGARYTVELSGNGYLPYKKTGVSFSEPLNLTNADFIPGDVNFDGKIDTNDKTAFELIKNGEYSDYADFNRDGKVDRYDDIFDDGVIKTVPEKMARPTLTGGAKEITIEWTAPENGGADITGYIINYGTSKTNLNKTKEVTNPRATSTSISDLSAGTTYYVQIAAKNEIGVGEYSNIANEKTDNESDGGGGGGIGGAGGIGGGTTPPPQTPVAPIAEPFTDLANYAWAKDAIYTLKNKGIISGVSETEYAPQNNIKRGDFILILTRMLGIDNSFTENFADVPVNSYYYTAIGKAKAAGIATGDGINFMPENTITRQDLITLAYRAFLNLGYISEGENTSSIEIFADKAEVSDYAVKAMSSMVSIGIIQGSNGNVNPKGNATRAEVAVMCARLLNLIK